MIPNQSAARLLRAILTARGIGPDHDPAPRSGTAARNLAALAGEWGLDRQDFATLARLDAGEIIESERP